MTKKYDQMRFIFQNNLLWAPHFFHRSYNARIPLVKKVINSRYNVII